MIESPLQNKLTVVLNGAQRSEESLFPMRIRDASPSAQHDNARVKFILLDIWKTHFSGDNHAD
jgi:hypothetical protein